MGDTHRRYLPGLLPNSHPAASAELRLAETARATSDFARGMVPTGSPAVLLPGVLVDDAIQLMRHAQDVLASAVRVELAAGTSPRALADALGEHEDATRSRSEMLLDEVPAAISSEDLADQLFDLDTWVRRHHEDDDSRLTAHPVTDAVLGHLHAPPADQRD
jgi:hypothetical protein